MGQDCSRKILQLAVEPEWIPRFFRLFQKGVVVKARSGASVAKFLCNDLGMNPSYMEERVQTCFIDGKAVDDLDSALIEPGAVLSLSGALPGLLGATLRKGSPYASMRTEISHEKRGGEGFRGQAFVHLKLFNLVAKEFGRELLQRGFCIEGKELRNFFRDQDASFFEKCKEALLDDVKIDLMDLIETLSEADSIFFQLRAVPE